MQNSNTEADIPHCVKVISYKTKTGHGTSTRQVGKMLSQNWRELEPKLDKEKKSKENNRKTQRYVHETVMYIRPSKLSCYPSDLKPNDC